MTTTTVETQTPVLSPLGTARGRVASIAASSRDAWSAWTAERREVRAFRAQERAFGSLCGTERSDVLVAARRAA